jgi:hypothetical protein
VAGRKEGRKEGRNNTAYLMIRKEGRKKGGTMEETCWRQAILR